MLHILLLILFLLILAGFVLFSASILSSDFESRASFLFSRLRCLVCEHQSIADSNSDLAKSFRSIIYEKLSSGNSDEEILLYFSSRYGEYILLSPVFDYHTFFLWLFPFTFFIIGLLFLLIRSFR